MNISETEKQELDMHAAAEARRVEGFYKILTRITNEYALKYIGTNHIILHDKGTGERIDLNGLLPTFKWCVCYTVDFFNEDSVPLSKLYYLPMALIRRASDGAMLWESKTNGRS